MKVILMEQLRKLGKTGDVIEVKNGYARNFLIPQEKAMRATKANIAYFEEKKSEIEKLNAEKSEIAQKDAKKIDGVICALIEQAAEDGRLYGSVAAAQIAEAASEKSGIQIAKQSINLNTPIKYLGIHEVTVELFGDVTAKVNINIARSKDEAKDTEARFKKGEISAGEAIIKQNVDAEEEQIQEVAQTPTVEEATEGDSTTDESEAA